jgi:ABC-type branched-subunit amino acid transport system substrate-binding protein
MAESLYTTGGTVQAQEGGLYLVRPADQQLLELCRQSRFAYVLTPRQLGKSSLMIRAAEELLAEGFRAVTVDLTQIGTSTDPETWYGDVLEVVADQLELATNARTWWQQEAETGLTLRLTRFFEKVVLTEVSEPIVIFVDEIDTTLSLGFTDDFFAAIRYFYVARAQNPALRRLSFVLIGVATPADLIRDPKRTPVNIGERVDLRDFTPAEAAPLAAGLPLPPEQAQRALGWILGWTGGHPYLSQRLCSVLATDPPAEWSEAAVDQAVGRNFFGERSEQDNNLQFVRDMLTKRAPQGYGAELLRTYRSIWQGKQPLADEEQNLVHAHLKLAGVVRRDGRQLVVRNRLYREVFNAAWIAEHNPEEFWKRYGPALKWAVPLSASVSALLVAGIMNVFYHHARDVSGVKAIEAYCLDETEKSADDISCGEQDIFPQTPGEPPLETGYQEFRAKNYQGALDQFKGFRYRDDPQAEIAANNAKILLTKDPGRIYTIAISLPGGSTRADIQRNLLLGVAKAQSRFNALRYPLNNAKLFVLMANDGSDSKKAVKIASNLANQQFVLGMIGTYSSKITFHQLLALKNKQLPYISASSTATKAAFLLEASQKGVSLGDLSLFLRSINTTDAEADGMAQLIYEHQPKKTKFLFFYQEDDLYTQSFRTSFDKSLKKRGISKPEAIDLNRIAAEENPEKIIREKLRRYQLEYRDTKDWQVVAILMNAARKKEIRNLVETIINQNKNGDFLLVGSNTLVGDDSLAKTIIDNEKARRSFLASITYSPNNQVGNLGRLAGTSYDATAILLSAARAASRNGRVTRPLVAEELRSGNLDINLIGRQFKIRDAERYPKKSYSVSPVCDPSRKCRWP